MNAVEPMAVPIDEGGHTAERSCLNCAAPLLGAYCHRCGQKGELHRTLSSLGHDLVHGLFHFEGRIWRTLPMLAWRPGELTRRYVEGERTRFVSPLATFLFSVFLLATVLTALPGGSFLDGLASGLAEPAKVSDARAGIAKKLAAAQAERERLVSTGAPTIKVDETISDLEGEERALAALVADSPSKALAAGDVRTDIPAIDQRWRAAKKNPDLLVYKIKESAYKYSWALIPLSLPFLWLMFPFSRRYRMYDHAIFTIYSLSFMSLLVIVLAVASQTLISEAVIVGGLLLLPPWHLYRQLRGAYLLKRWSALWRTAALLLCAILVLVFWAVGLMLLGAA